MRGTGTGSGYAPTDPEYERLALPIRRVRHPTRGEMDVKIDFTCMVHFVDGPPVVETLELIQQKVSEALIAFEPELT